jgi:hypothetical protein
MLIPDGGNGPVRELKMKNLAAKRRRFRSGWALVAVLLGICAYQFIPAADHSDAPILIGTVRQDANLTDLHAFTVGRNLVLALSTNAAIPPAATSYIFPSDVTFEFHIDMDSAMDEMDPMGMGGTILDPQRIGEEITFRIRFREDGSARLQRIGKGMKNDELQLVNFFAGLRDDPFIRGPRQGRNVASIVLETPLDTLHLKQDMVLIWATSKVDDFDGQFHDLAGRALRSMFPEQQQMNNWFPRLQQRKTGLVPDVMIYDLSKLAAYPNGRALSDDVVDLVGDARVLANDSPFPSTNDVPFLASFPYLAPPHQAVP